MDQYPKAKEVLKTLGIVSFISLSILLPGLPKALSPFLKKQHKSWGHFNRRRLKTELKRLEGVGYVEQLDEKGEILYRLTKKGRNKLFIYKLDDLTLENRAWDGKWRLVAYDIPKYKKNEADSFRKLLKKLTFYRLQKSLWLTPYKCESEIQFLKDLYNLNDCVTILTISKLEGEIYYKKYFGL